MTTDRSEAAELAQRLQSLNQKRQEIEEGVMSQAMEQLALREDDFGPIVLAVTAGIPACSGLSPRAWRTNTIAGSGFFGR